MIGKLQKIREDVERIINRRLNLLNGDYFDLNEETDGLTNEIMDIIDPLQEEPVSEDLGEYINELSKQFQEVSFAKLSRIAVRVAKWQKEQFEKNRLAHCDAQTEEEAEIELDFVMSIIEKEHRQPTFDDAIKYGMNLQKEQMMAKAGNGRIDAISNRQTRAHITVVFDSPRDIEVLDRLKVIVIKEN